MDWLVSLCTILGGVLLAMGLGMPVAFAFLLVSAVGVMVLQGGSGALLQLVVNTATSVSSFSLVPIPLFVFMGVMLWHSNLGQGAIDALDKWLGRVPGRLSVLTILSGSVFRRSAAPPWRIRQCSERCCCHSSKRGSTRET